MDCRVLDMAEGPNNTTLEGAEGWEEPFCINSQPSALRVFWSPQAPEHLKYNIYIYTVIRTIAITEPRTLTRTD